MVEERLFLHRASGITYSLSPDITLEQRRGKWVKARMSREWIVRNCDRVGILMHTDK